MRSLVAALRQLEVHMNLTNNLGRAKHFKMASFPRIPTFPIRHHQIVNPRKNLHQIFHPNNKKMSSSWACSKCTFINSSSSHKSTCQICSSPSPLSSVLFADSPSSSSPSAAVPRWPCKACTFLNLYRHSNCEICGNRASASCLSTFEELTGEDELDSSVGSVFLPLRVCNKRKEPVGVVDDSDEVMEIPAVKLTHKDVPMLRVCNKRKDRDPSGIVDNSNEVIEIPAAKPTKKDVSMLGGMASDTHLRSFKILSYNVWFREDLEMVERMNAIGHLIQLHSPDFICFQEVTPDIYNIFKRSSWWKAYQSSVPNDGAYFCMQLSKLSVDSFGRKPFNTIMGRELLIADLKMQGDKRLVIATSHLESPCPSPPTWNQMFSKERVGQANEAINFLKSYPNAIFCGDMNWDDKLDGQFPLPEGWVDAWTELRPGENGWTYDTKSNQMLSQNRTLQKRLDRFVCGLRDYKITEVSMIGMEAIPGLTYCKEKKVKQEMKKLVLPVLPSDHYGLLLTICER